MYQVTLEFEVLGKMVFAPFWQRICNDSFQLKLKWITEIILAEVKFDSIKNCLYCTWKYKGKSATTILTRYSNIIFPGKDALILEDIGRYALLRKYSAYAPSDTKPDVLFTYSDGSSEELKKLRSKLQLDLLIADNDFSTMRNVMGLINQKLIHDGYQNFGA